MRMRSYARWSVTLIHAVRVDEWMSICLDVRLALAQMLVVHVLKDAYFSLDYFCLWSSSVLVTPIPRSPTTILSTMYFRRTQTLPSGIDIDLEYITCNISRSHFKWSV